MNLVIVLRVDQNCPKKNRCGINDCRGSHHFHLHFESRSNSPERVDAAVGTRSAFSDPEFEGDEAWTLNEMCQGLCISGQTGINTRSNGNT